MKQGQCSHALASFQEVIKSNPQDSAALEDMGQCYAAEGDYADAAKVLADAARYGDTHLSYELWAQVEFQQGNDGVAGNLLSKASQASDSTPASRVSDAGTALQHGLPGVAVQILDMVAVASRDYQWYAAMGSARVGLNQLTLAAKAFASATSECPSYSLGSLLVTIGTTYLAAGIDGTAVGYLNHALAVQPTDPSYAFDALGQAEEGLGKVAEARTAFEAAMKSAGSASEFAIAGLALASADIRAGDLSAARLVLSDVKQRRGLSSSQLSQVDALQSALSRPS